MTLVDKPQLLIITLLIFSLLQQSDGKEVCERLELDQDIVIGYKYSPPFVMVSSGKPQGISINFWQEIAKCLAIPEDPHNLDSINGYRWQWVKNIDGLIGGVKNCDSEKKCELDLAMAAISITPEREMEIDFSHRYYEGSLGVLVPANDGGRRFILLFKRILSSELLIIILGLLGFMLLVAYGYWYGERKEDNEFFRGGFFKAIIWSILLVFQGKGDPYSLKTRFGQIFFLFLMFFGVTIVSSFTAIITSSLTLQGLEKSITSLHDLKNSKVAVISNSGVHKLISSQDDSIDLYNIDNLTQVQGAFDRGETQAFIHDRDILEYLVSKGLLQDVKLAPLSINPQDYGVAFPQGSPLLEPINRAILQARSNPEWKERLFESLN